MPLRCRAVLSLLFLADVAQCAGKRAARCLIAAAAADGSSAAPGLAGSSQPAPGALAGRGGLVSLPPPKKREFVGLSDAYEHLPWYPGNEECWSGRRHYVCAESPTLINIDRVGCERANRADDGFEYRPNLGHTSGVGSVCGVGCSCCRRQLVRRRQQRMLSFQSCCSNFTAGVGNPACWAHSGGGVGDADAGSGGSGAAAAVSGGSAGGELSR
mmetsp:Transcript_78167/g.253717  ORF Transcript_78167/g.253717 Transcript_78167/m.253717 type:complete len:214 (-) Transcript_78167:2710-3351(-)